MFCRETMRPGDEMIASCIEKKFVFWIRETLFACVKFCELY